MENEEKRSKMLLKGGWARIDFTNSEKEFYTTNTDTLLIDGRSSGVSLMPVGVATGAGVDFFLLKVEFLQQEGGIQYPLKNGSYNALSIIEVV